MQSNNGDLYFRAGIDLDGFNAGATAMEKRMETASSNVVGSAGQMDDAISKIGGAFTRIVGAGAAAGFVKQMFNVRSEMQNTEAMLRVFLGSTEKAASFFKQLQGYAYNNVFEFKDLAAQSAQMLAYGNAVETVIPTINKLSEVAAGTNVPLEELVGIWNKVKVTDKMDSNTIYSLGAKGIDVRQAIADIKELETGQKMLAKEVDTTGLKFKDLQKIIDHVATNGGMFDGMMQEKMKTLGDSFGLMQDNLTNMFNEIGEKNQGLLKGGMDVANYLIENYESVAKVLGTLVVAYGTAKAASIAFNIAQKNGTGVAVLDNTVWAIRGNLLKVNAEGGKNITASIRQINAAQKEEIAALKAAITEQEHEEILRKSRIANLDDILDATQKARLAQMGLNSTSEEYLPIAVSMLTREQKMQMVKADLIKNNQAYIEALRGVVGVHGDEINSIDDRIEAATKELALAEKAADAAADEKEQLEEKVKIYQDYYEASLNNIKATDLQERQEALKTAQSELEAAAENAESAAETRNTAQKKLNELQTKKNAVAEGVDAKATKSNAVTKNLLTVAAGKLRIGLKALWAVMKANPVGAVITVVTSLYTIISHFINKSKEAKEAQAEENKEMAEFHKEVNAAKDRLNTLQVALYTATRGSAAYNQALKQVNDMCKEYNVELINTNDNLQTQKQKYDALKEAIEGVTAAKLREQFATTAMQNQSNRNEETMGTFRENMQNKHIFTEGFRNVWGDEVKFNTMWSLMLNKAQEAASGDSHTYIAAVDDLIKAMQKISGFQIDRQGNAAGYLRNAFKGLVESAKEAQRDVQRADNALKIYEQTMNAHRGTVQEETTSVSDLNRQLADQEAIISRLEKKARTGLTKKEEEELEAARQRKSDIEKRKKNMTGQSANTTKKDADDRKKAIEQMTDTELKLENERQAAIISTMREGAEKRQAQLRLEYQQRLQTIKAAEEEYSRQRKAAGESGDIDPNSAAGQSFAAQRLAAEMEYQDKSMTVFDNEIEERKQKYEEYQRWVEAVGKDAANKQFEDLIAEGRTFEEWVNRQSERLNKKGQSEDLTVGDFYFAQDLMREKRAIQNGQAEQSYKAMGEEIQKEIAVATTLAEKLEIIDKWLSRIKNNSDNSDARNDFLLNLSQHRTELIDEQNTQFNQTYEKYAKKRLMIERDYNHQISELNRQHRTLEAEEVKRSLENTLQELDTDFLKGLVSTVFKNPTKSNMREAMKTLQAIQKMSLKEFNAQFGTEDFQFTQEQLDDIKNSISDVGTEIKKLGQGYTLADAFREIRDGRIEGDMEKVARGTEYMQSAFSKFASVVSTLSQALNDIADASNNENLKKTAKTVNSVANVLTSTGSMTAAGAQVGGGWGALAGSILGLGTGVLSEVFKSSAEKEAEIANNTKTAIDFQHQVSGQLLNILNAVQSLDDTVTSLNYDQYRDALLSLMNELREGHSLYKDGKDGNSFWSYLYRAILGNSGNTGSAVFGSGNLTTDIWDKFWQYGFISQGEAEQRWNEARHNSDSRTFWDWLDYIYSFGTDDSQTFNPDLMKENTAESMANYLNWYFGQFAEEQKNLIDKLQELYNKNSFNSLDIFNAEHDVYNSQYRELDAYKRLYEMLGMTDTDEYRALIKEISELEHQMGESLQNMTEGLFGTDIQSIVEDWISIFQEFGDNVDGAFAKIDEGLDRMIANMLLKRNVVEPLLEQMSQIFTDYAKEVGNDHEYTEEDFRILGERLRGAKGDAYEAYQRYMNALEAAGISIDSLIDNTTMTGSLQNLSEETGGVIAGRLNAMVINQAEGNNFLRQSLLVQYEMRNSLQGIQSDVATIKQRMNSANAIPFNTNVNYGYSEMAR